MVPTSARFVGQEFGRILFLFANAQYPAEEAIRTKHAPISRRNDAQT
jgi:hypothetical protein